LAILGPVGGFDDIFFWAHMTQHLILTMLAAPLLVLGEPVLLILRVATPAWRRRRVVPILRSKVIRWLTDPVATWLLFVVVLLGTHFSPFYDYALNHSWVHDFVEHPLYLIAALLFYYPLLATNPGPRTLAPAGRVISLALMMVPEAFTGFFIYATPYVMYPFYASVQRPFGPGVLADQQLGGALMWSSSMLLDTAWLALAAREWLRADARRTRRLDAALAQEAIGVQIQLL
ncbi:MAG: cytochrome c oxidase assembly protein, partial [Jatrophihabitantaceae bacterium]